MHGINDWSALLFDIGTIALMLAVLVACFIVYRRLEAVRQSQRELGELVERLERAGTSAQAAIENLCGQASHIGERLEGHIATGRGLKDELTAIVQSGTALAERLEILLTERRREVVDQLRMDRPETDADSEDNIPSTDRDPAPAQARIALLDALKEAR
ncbi:MAG: hypothetical protein D6757_09280 [Alphaproteobacteria bacterium]|nr:MAG: hypothetical protein D6757_09280 [Alphaproteobacteria bacterium]